MAVSEHTSYDVVIIGGGVIGSSVAYFLTRDSMLSVAVVECDPSYEKSATPRSAGGVRSQFSTRPNVMMSLFGAEFVRAAPDLLAVDGDRPAIGFRENGYLLLASDAGVAQLQENHALQTDCGAAVSILDRADLAQRFPWLNLTDLACGAFGEQNEGWLDPYSLLQGFKRKARAQGAKYFTDTVVGLTRTDGRIDKVLLQSGQTLTCGAVVNASGVNGRQTAAMAGITDLPVFGKKRQIFAFNCKEPIAKMPLTVDPSGVYCRPENEMFICGLAPPEDDDPDSASFDVDHGQFDNDIWPVLATRIPQFEAIKVVNAWAGHYDVNLFDQNAILGPHPEITNFHFANGFSGHGLQQSPAVGRALSEMINTGRYTSLDLSDFGYDRIARNRPILEKNVI